MIGRGSAFPSPMTLMLRRGSDTNSGAREDVAQGPEQGLWGGPPVVVVELAVKRHGQHVTGVRPLDVVGPLLAADVDGDARLLERQALELDDLAEDAIVVAAQVPLQEAG